MIDTWVHPPSMQWRGCYIDQIKDETMKRTEEEVNALGKKQFAERKDCVTDYSAQCYRDGYIQGQKDALAWIPCAERMPQENMPVLGFGCSDHICRVYWCGSYWTDDSEFIIDTPVYTHWMPLPPAPEVAK